MFTNFNLGNNLSCVMHKITKLACIFSIACVVVLQDSSDYRLKYEHCCEKTGLRGF